ncbi:putative ethylene-responsive transcription factor [Helianthus annuus]|nr:putative ethylene-responsive transcription factor [Helianthus annuus]
MAYDQAAFSMRGPHTLLNISVERLKKSLKEMKYGLEEGCSHVMALKRRYSLRKRSVAQKKKPTAAAVLDESGNDSCGNQTMVFEDLGVDFMEELLLLAESSTPLLDFFCFSCIQCRSLRFPTEGSKTYILKNFYKTGVVENVYT